MIRRWFRRIFPPQVKPDETHDNHIQFLKEARTFGVEVKHESIRRQLREQGTDVENALSRAMKETQRGAW